ncbi:MAG TPA: hypothetical protein VE988_10615 [Gemmataceae bacterium]|nr:hypothetical protein [Gemmataceae bacterium]
MTTITGTVRDGRIETEKPLDLPDGTQLVIPLPANGEGVGENDLPESLEAREDWTRWYNALEPMEFTEEERAARDAARKAQKEYELSQWDKRSQSIEGIFQ